jgi:3-phenylpropionate/cinnamic acid dioxygenase small subunit
MSQLQLHAVDRVQLQVLRFYADYAAVMDRKQGAQWVDMFIEDGVYGVTSHNNAEGAGMWWYVDRGRIKLFERAAYNHGYFWHQPDKMLHQITNVRVVEVTDELVRTEAYFSLFVADRSGPSELHVCGEFRDVMVPSPDGGLVFAEHRVIVDGETVPQNMGVPL